MAPNNVIAALSAVCVNKDALNVDRFPMTTLQGVNKSVL